MKRNLTDIKSLFVNELVTLNSVLLYIFQNAKTLFPGLKCILIFFCSSRLHFYD